MAFLTDLSTNNLQVTAYGNVDVDTSIFKYGGGSAYFPNADYNDSSKLVVNSPSLVLDSRNFTIEMWINVPSVMRDMVLLASTPEGTQNVDNASWSLVCRGATRQISFVSYGTILESSQNSFEFEQWVHVAVCRYSPDGFVTNLFINGLMVQSVEIFTMSPPEYGLVGIGNYAYDDQFAFTGHMDDLRITNGASRYITNFTPPSAQFIGPYDPYFNNVSLLMHMDGSNLSQNFIDSSKNNLAVTTIGNAFLDTGTKKIGNAAGYFNQEGRLLVANNSILNFGTGDFTVEAWIRLQNFGYSGIFGGPNGGFAIYVEWGILKVSHANVAEGPLVGTFQLKKDNFYHVAVTRENGYARLFLNGALESEDTWTANFSTTSDYQVGDIDSGNYPFDGWIDELRVTKGIARYTANFNPQTAPYANI